MNNEAALIPAGTVMRKGVFRRLSLVLMLTAAIILSAAFLIDRTRYAEYIKAKLIEVARGSGAVLTLDDPALGFLSFSSQRARLILPNLFLWLNFDAPHLSLGALRTLALTPTAALETAAYGGKIAALAKYSLLSSQLSVEGRAEGLLINKHDQLLGLGFTSGELSFELNDFLMESGELNGSTFSLKINRLDKPQPTVLSPRLTGMPIEFSIPSITDINLSVMGQVTGDSVKISQATFSSSLGNFQGTLEIAEALRSWEHSVFNGAFKVSLSDEGVKFIGPILELATKNAVSSTTKKFDLEIKGPPRSLQSDQFRSPLKLPGFTVKPNS